MKGSVDRLIRRVRQGEDAGTRREALIGLGYEKDEAVYPVLVEQLGDPSSSIQHAAVISLGRYGNPQAIEELIKPKVLQSPVVNIRWGAVAALGKLGDCRVIDHLLKAVDDPEWIIRNQAVTELKEKIREIIELKDCRYARILLRMLVLEDDEIVDLAVEGFFELGEKSENLLLDALHSPTPRMRENAARVLGETKAFQAVPPLVDLLKDPEWRVRRSVVEALGKIGDKRAVEPLVQRLRDNVERVQHQAIHSLVGFGQLSTVPLMNALAHEKNKFALRAIILTLGEIKDVKSIPILIDHLRSSYFVVRMVAVRALIKFGPPIIDPLVSALSFNQSDIKALLRDAEDRSNPPFQLRAMKALGGLEDHRAVDLLKRFVEEGESEVQDAAVQALIQIGCAAWGRCGALMVLSEIGDESFAFHFALSLLDDSDNVRLEAVRAFGKVGGSRAIDPLVKVAREDRDPYIRFEAIRLLRRVGVGFPQVLGLALSALKDPYRDVRSQAARLLGNFQHEKSIQPLLKVMEDPHWSVRESAENALINFGEKAVSSLIGALSSRSWTTRFRVARLLGEIGDTRAIEPLEWLLKKKRERKKVREVVQKSLKKLYGSVAA